MVGGVVAGVVDHLERVAGMLSEIETFELLLGDLAATQQPATSAFNQEAERLVEVAKVEFVFQSERAAALVQDYSALEDETIESIAAKLQLDLTVLLALNQPRYAGLTQHSRLMEGTSVVHPPAPAAVSVPRDCCIWILTAVFGY